MFGGGGDSFGGADADTLMGGTGNDTLTGGDAADVLVFQAGWGKDVITDFADGVDTIDLSSFAFADYAAFEAAVEISEVGGDVVIKFAAGQTLTVEDLSAAQLTETDYILS